MLVLPICCNFPFYLFLQHEQKDSPSSGLEQAIDGTVKSVYELRAQLQETALQQVSCLQLFFKEI